MGSDDHDVAAELHGVEFDRAQLGQTMSKIEPTPSRQIR
jgi:hypothetical protein